MVGGVPILISGGDDGLHAVSLRNINTPSPLPEPSADMPAADSQTARMAAGYRLRQLVKRKWPRRGWRG